jgi:rhodanese-related sulfurtransferase
MFSTLRFSRGTRLALVVIAFLTLGAAEASAQLVLTGGPVTRTGTSAGTTFTQAPGGEFAAAYTPGATAGAGTFTLNLTGDGSFRITPGVETVQFAAPEGYLQFTVGPLPVQITPRYALNFKLVNGGGTSDAPVNLTGAGGGVYETGTFSPSDGTGSLGANILNGNATHTLVGNGLHVFNDAATLPSYILAVGVNYTFYTGISSNVAAAGLTSYSPTSVVTIEAGGISGWAGATLDVAYTTVPEPASLGLLLLATAPAMLRPRKRTRA